MWLTYLGQVDAALLKEVPQAAGRGENQRHALADLVLLRRLGHAPVQASHIHAHALSRVRCHLGRLKRQLARGRYHQHLALGAYAPHHSRCTHTWQSSTRGKTGYGYMYERKMSACFNNLSAPSPAFNRFRRATLPRSFFGRKRLSQMVFVHHQRARVCPS